MINLQNSCLNKRNMEQNIDQLLILWERDASYSFMESNNEHVASYINTLFTKLNTLFSKLSCTKMAIIGAFISAKTIIIQHLTLVS